MDEAAGRSALGNLRTLRPSRTQVPDKKTREKAGKNAFKSGIHE
jgi:hypothetical protein